MRLQYLPLCLLCLFLAVNAFPENLKPISSRQDVQANVFTGGNGITSPKLHGLQVMKLIHVGGVSRIVVASRENLYFLDPASQIFSKDMEFDTDVFTWKSNPETRELCLMKGQSKKACHNFLSVVEETSQDQLLVCGTNSYDPACAKYQVSLVNGKVSLEQNGRNFTGKQRCPFGPSQANANIFTDGTLYSSTSTTFLGSTPVISRTLGDRPNLRTTTTSSIMTEPKFVKMTDDKDRVLVYFNEIQELSSGEKRTLAQVAQVCKNDVGGTNVLQRMFTTFIKSRLNCSYNGFFLDEVKDVTDPVLIDNQSVIFATFSTPENSLAGSAVCAFTYNAIHSSMTGRFLGSNGGTPAPFQTPSRHPGSCPDQTATDTEVLFTKLHPQMEKQVIGSLLLTNQGQRWSAIAVDPFAGPNNVTMVFLGTEDGHLIRALPPSSGWPHRTIVSDDTVFDVTKCSSAHSSSHDKKVLRIVLKDPFILVAFSNCVVSVPLRSCALHRCRSACLGAADPYCGWNGTACIPFIHPNPLLEQNLSSALSSSAEPCPEIVTSELIEIKDNSVKVVVEEDLLVSVPKTIIGSEEEPNLPEKCPSTNPYSYQMLIIVAVITFFVTTIIGMFISILYCRVCYRNKTRDVEEKFKSYQFKKQHHLAVDPDEKRGSLSQKARKTYQTCKEFLYKATTPVQSPQLQPKNQPQRQRRQNNYTEAPSFQQKHAEKMKASRKSSSRQNSISSSTSRQDCIGHHIAASQPLLTPTSDVDLTLPKHISDAPTLRLSSKPNCESPSSSVSPGSTGGSFYYPDSGNGVAETGVLPTASAKLRRRNERALNQTNEIMRESDTAIRKFESALQQMQEHGFTQSSVPNRLARHRLDSQDSGKGDSPRNSLRTDLEQPVAVITSRAQRPTSLNIQRSMSGKRHRLLSEGSYPPDNSSPIVIAQRPPQNRSPNGHHSSRSQPTTPVGGPQNYSIYMPESSEIPVYATLPKNDCNNMMHLKQRPVQPMQPQQQYINYHQQMLPKQPVYHQPVYHHQISEPDRRSWAPRTCTSPIKPQPNYYPSLQVRGTHAQKPVSNYQQWPVSNSPPKNHYPSLPHRSSSAPFGGNNSYTTETGFERPATLHRREKLPSIMRQTSMSNSTRPAALFVPPPKVPSSGIA